MGKDYTPHQRRVIRDYYRNRDAIETQRLQELVTEIALASSARKQERLWTRAAEILERTEGLDGGEAERIVTERDLEALARVAEDRFQNPS